MDKKTLLFLGTGNPHSVAFNTSILIGDEILLDSPPGVEKRIMEMGRKLDSLEIVFISHFHGDHTLGLPQLLIYCGRVLHRTKKLYLIGPEGLESNIRAIIDLSFPHETNSILDSANVRFISLSGSKINISLCGYDLTFLRLSHGDVDNYGCLIDINAHTIGYSGDTGPCDNLEMLIDSADYLLLDMTFLRTRNTHLGVDYLRELGSRFYGKKNIYAIHRGDETEDVPHIYGVNFPKKGDEYALD